MESPKIGVHIHSDHGPCFNFVRRSGGNVERVTAIIYPEVEAERVVYACSAKCFNPDCKFAQRKEDESGVTPI